MSIIKYQLEPKASEYISYIETETKTKAKEQTVQREKERMNG